MKEINIHLVLSEEAYNYCRKVNAEIRKITKSEIVFNNKSPMIPHISLIRGHIQDDNAISEIADLTQSIVSEFDSPKLLIHSPYLATNGNHYILSDVSAGNIFSELRQKLFSQLTSQLIQPQNSKTETPHITLGYIDDKQEEVQDYLETVEAEFDFSSPAVEISEEGNRGTCINSLYNFDF